MPIGPQKVLYFIAPLMIQARQEIGDHLLDAPTISIPDRLSEKVIYFDLVGNDTMLVFCSMFAKRILADYGSTICIDGTFKVDILDVQLIEYLSADHCNSHSFTQ